MNWAHVHLILNHIPLIALPVALTFLLQNHWSGYWPGRKLAYSVLMLLSLVVLPVYLTGEPAEKIVETLSNIEAPNIKAHEEAAEVSLVLTLLTGLCALAGLYVGQHSDKAILVGRLTIGIAVVAILSLGYTSNLGGKIRHSEIKLENVK